MSRISVGTNVEVHVEADDAAEARRHFDALSDAGTVSMPLTLAATSPGTDAHCAAASFTA